MELKNIIEKLKREGVGEAEKEAARIKSKADSEAKTLLENARKERDEILREAERESSKMRSTGEEALRQASRDVLLGLRESMVVLFDSVLKEEVAKQLSSETVKEMVLKLVEAMAKERSFDVEILLSEEDRASMEKALVGELKKLLKKGAVLKASPHLEHGFRIGEKDGSSYYDFSDEAITEAFKAYLNPKLIDLLASGEAE